MEVRSGMPSEPAGIGPAQHGAAAGAGGPEG